MENWKPAAPTPSDLGDRELPQLSDALAGKQIALMVSGSIAAFKTPMVARELRRHGAAVTTYASRSALRYVSAEALAWSSASCATVAVLGLPIAGARITRWPRCFGEEDQLPHERVPGAAGERRRRGDPMQRVLVQEYTLLLPAT